MSSIRIFILGSLEQRGPMHGHQLRLLAEQENVAMWTDITVGGLYGALKRLATESLIEQVRVEQAGSYPPRQIWSITEAGREALGALRMRALSAIVIKPDPFDLAMTRLDPDHLTDLPATVAARVAALSAMIAEWEARAAAADRYLTVAEKLMVKHRLDRLRGEITWHQELEHRLPEIIADEQARKGQ
ncbi:MAG: PadR family transcriptional regulator [Mycobacterium sp.]|uniref:PadR family transcriptional regulator n=1 Tax=Mycobacterium sp. TaxID=1785 RepID=UPI003C3F9BDE